MDNLHFYSNQTTDAKIVLSLESIARAYRVLLWQKSKEFSLTPIQVQILIFLLHHTDEKRKVSYLAKEFNITKATVSDTVKTLEQKGLVVKKNEVSDSRSYILYLTEKGEKTAVKLSNFADEIYKPINNLTKEKKESFFLNLVSILSHLNQTGIISVQRMCTSCAHFKSSEGINLYYCTLQDKELQELDLRIDCQEYENH